MHCQICNFCETTGTPSDFETEFRLHANYVKWDNRLNGYYCKECLISMAFTSITYKEELKEMQKDQQKEVDDTAQHQPKRKRRQKRPLQKIESHKEPSALSEVL